MDNKDTTTKDKILVVANMFFDENGEEIIRIISGRKANQKERIFSTLKEYHMSNIKEREKFDNYEMLERSLLSVNYKPSISFY